MKNKIKSNKLKIVIDYTFIIIGTYLMSLSVNFFLLPNMITTGGITGIGTILYHLYEIDISVTMIILNIPLYIIGSKVLGFKFTFRSIIATIIFTIFLEVITYENLTRKIGTDMIISAIYGGIILGIRLSLVFKAGASTGGTDLLANIINKHNNNLNIDKLMLYIDGVIISLLIILLKDLNIGLYSIIAIYLSSKMISLIFEGVNYTKVINIITKNNEKIIKYIIKELDRSATITNVHGAYEGKDKVNITCIASLPEIALIKKIINKYDDKAFVYILNTHEVIGKGFK